MKLPVYPNYKPSGLSACGHAQAGVEWLGDVPEHWEVKRGRFAMRVNPPAPRLRALKPEDEVSFVPMDAVGVGGGLSLEQTRILSEVSSGYTEFQDGDVVVAKITPCFENGKAALASGLLNGAAYGTTELHVLRAGPTLDRSFLFYVAISDTFQKLGESEMYGAGGQKRVPPEFNKNFRTALPPPAEQRSIAAFLDRETGRVDRLVAKKRELIERLKEKRTALISRTVTRGLPPAAARAAGLPAKPPLKPSALDWLGDIPTHWEVLPLKRVAQISYGVGGEIDRSLEEGLRTLSLPNIDFEGNLNLDGVPYAEVSEKEKREVLLRKGDLLFNWRNGSSDHLGKTAFFDAEGEYSHVSFLLRIRFNPEKHCSKFFRYLLGGYRVTGFFKHSKAGVNNTFNLSELSELPVMFPPLPEQAAIAAYLDEETAKLDALVGKVAEAVERLQEYRTALITAAVTGKIDVRKAVGQVSDLPVGGVSDSVLASKQTGLQSKPQPSGRRPDPRA
ncbi:MAG: restriction endonuclease subunit S [Verrucomicrobia bacterium]|jgi:type I restriction enzyme S subunit|nr:restriction endonuclease subunit S [Verrucomicrobiota bacterium]